jgi:hypothetical protein
MAPVAKRPRVDDAAAADPTPTAMLYGAGGVYDGVNGDRCRRVPSPPLHRARGYPAAPPPPEPGWETRPAAAAVEEEEGGAEPLLSLTDPAAWRPILEDGFAAGRTLPRMWADTVAPLVGVPFPYAADGGDGVSASSSPRTRGAAAQRLRAFGDALWSLVGHGLPVADPEAWARWRRLIDDIRTCTPVVLPVVVGDVEAALLLLCHYSPQR